MLEQAEKGELEHWRDDPFGALALVIILDQFPLNMFRGQPRSFATEEQAMATMTNYKLEPEIYSFNKYLQ